MKLLIPTLHEFQQIEAGTLQGFVRPFEEQPILVTINTMKGWEWKCPGGHRHCWPVNSSVCRAVIADCFPHQPDDVLAVAEEWYKIRPLPPPQAKMQPAKTMPANLAHYRVEITDVWPVQVTKLHGRYIEEELGYPQAYAISRAFQYKTDWNAAYPELPFDKEPWAWLFTCQVQEKKE